MRLPHIIAVQLCKWETGESTCGQKSLSVEEEKPRVRFLIPQPTWTLEHDKEKPFFLFHNHNNFSEFLLLPFIISLSLLMRMRSRWGQKLSALERKTPFLSQKTLHFYFYSGIHIDSALLANHIKSLLVI